MLSTPLIISILVALFFIGLGLGYIYSVNSEESTKEKMRTVIAIVVTLVWVVAMMADIFITGYTVHVLVHGLMGAVVGFFFAEKGININVGGEN